ncbi:MAG: trigger factor [Deinococcales bacterium]
MEAELIEKQAVNATFKVTVPAGEVDAAFDRVLNTLSREMKVPGFRPGRAPRGVLERRIGRETLEEEVQEALVDANYPDAVRELELMPVHAHFHADPPKEGEAFTFEVHAELYPEVELPELSEIVIDAAPQELTEAMVDDTVEQLRNQNATLVPVERTVEGTDYVLLESLPPASEAEGADDDASEPQGTGSVQPVDMESASEGIREQLIGTRIGEIIDLELIDDAQPPEEGAEPVKRSLRVIVKDVKGKEKPEIDDEFAKTLGFETWAEARQEIEASLKRQLDRDAFDAQREEFLDKLVASTDFEVPSSLLQRRQRSLLQDLADDLRQQGTTLERYLADLDEKQGREEFEQELQQAAERGVRRDLVLERLQEIRGTEVSDDELDDAVRYLARQRRQEAGRFKREMGERWLSNYRFLLARDKALRETVRELTGAVQAEDAEVAQADYESAAAGADAGDEDEDDDAHRDENGDENEAERTPEV